MLLEYQLDWIKIVDFLLIAKFWASPNNFESPSTYIPFFKNIAKGLSPLNLNEFYYAKISQKVI